MSAHPARVQAISRGQWFGMTFLLLSMNGAARLAATTIIQEGGLVAAVNLFGVSAIIWMAVAAGASLSFNDPDKTPLGRTDVVAVAAAITLMIIPVAPLSSVALTALGAWVVIRTRRDRPLRRGALIFIAITGSLLWGRALLAAGSDLFLSWDGRIAGLVAGTGGTANVVQFANNAGTYYVAPGCSSLQGISLAIVLWVTVVQYYNLTIGRRALITLGAAITGAIVANVLRLAAIASWPAHFDSLHAGLGATVFGWLGLFLIIAAVGIGLRHALFRPV